MRSPVRKRPATRRSRPGFHHRLAIGGSDTLAARAHAFPLRFRTAICRLPSGMRSLCVVLRAPVCVRSLAGSPSTISRELRRNASTRTWRLEYRATTAQWHAERRARRPKPAKLAVNDRLRGYVQDRLSGRVLGPEGPQWSGKNKPHRAATAAGCGPGTPSSSQTA